MRPGSWVAIDISDTGIGVADHIQERVFEPFFSTKPPGQSTGLGLAQAYGIVQELDGHIGLDSVEGKGTTVSVYLPEVESAVPVEEPVTGPDLPRGRGELILAVEDERPLLRIMARGLSDLGYSVLTASDGEQALALYYRYKDDISLVLVDVVMPGMSGFELFRRLRALNPGLRVVFISGHPRGDVQVDLENEVGVELVLKPISIDKLARIVHEAIA
jgi:CheY-like chemotaxis protein